MEPRVYKR